MFKYLYTKEAVYKASAFAKHNVSIKVGLFVNEIVSVKGFITKNGKDTLVDITIDINAYTSVERTSFKGTPALLIRGNIESQEESSDYVEITIPGIDDFDDVNAAINEGKRVKKERLEKADAKKKELLEAQEAEDDGSLKVKQDEFYAAEFTAYGDKYPTFFLDKHDEFTTFIYIDSSKSINIKSIDKKKMRAVSTFIDYTAIRFFEIAGRIPSDTYDNLSIVASLDPTKMIMIPSVIGTLLFGPMNLTPRSLIGYDKSRFENAEVNIASIYKSAEAAMITDSNIIMDFYSDKESEYISVELPRDIYDFLIQNIGDKVLATAEPAVEEAPVVEEPVVEEPVVEAPVVEEKPEPVAPKAPIPSAAPAETKPTAPKPEAKASAPTDSDLPTGKLTFDEMEAAVKKLKLMYDYEVISEEEFNRKKEELMKNLV